MPFAKYDLDRKWDKVAAGEEITIISDHGDVMIVRNSDGLRFSMHKDMIGYSDEEMAEIQKSQPATAVNKPKGTSPKKTSSGSKQAPGRNTTPTLF